MPDKDLVESWARTTAHLDAARSALEPLPAESERWVAEWLEHNELGLAFETLVDAAEAQGAGPECWASLGRAAVEMELDDDSHHARIVRQHDSG